jgi:hypothetical protein
MKLVGSYFKRLFGSGHLFTEKNHCSTKLFRFQMASSDRLKQLWPASFSGLPFCSRRLLTSVVLCGAAYQEQYEKVDELPKSLE